MIQGMLGLSIRVPELNQPTLVAKMTPKLVSKWLDALPVANISDSSKKLYQMLLECNKAALDDDDRFKILMLLHPQIQLILKSLSKHFTGHTLNLTDKQKKIAALVQAIHTEMAIGFKTIIEHQAESPSLLRKSMLHASLFLSLEYLSLTVVRCYQIYTDVPARLWKEINTIYRYALEQKLHEKKSNFDGFQQEHSIIDVFRKICLLSIANPYQLRQQEIESVFTGLQKYVEHCLLEPSNRYDNRYVINLHEAHPPIHQALIKTRPSQYTLAMNLDEVVNQLHLTLKDKRSSLREEVSIGGLSIRLIRHLLKSWAHLSSRSFARTPCNGNLRVSIGLNATHQILAGPEPEEQEVETLSRLEGSLQNATILDDDATANMLSNFGNEGLVSPKNEEDVWAKLYRPRQAMPVTSEIDYAKAFGQNNKPNKSLYELVDADIVNISPGGYCIQLDQNPPIQTQTGEVIGILEIENQEENWHIGVIRWIKRAKDKSGVQLGVQLIAPGARPIRSQLKAGKMNGKSFQSALLLPELKGMGQPATILTNPVLYNPNQKITVIDNGDVFEARLTKLVSSSQGYRQFYFEKLQSETPKTGLGHDLGSSDDGFDNVWDLI